jgi:hypothetical protein
MGAESVVQEERWCPGGIRRSVIWGAFSKVARLFSDFLEEHGWRGRWAL